MMTWWSINGMFFAHGCARKDKNSEEYNENT